MPLSIFRSSRGGNGIGLQLMPWEGPSKRLLNFRLPEVIFLLDYYLLGLALDESAFSNASETREAVPLTQLSDKSRTQLIKIHGVIPDSPLLIKYSQSRLSRWTPSHTHSASN